MSAWFRLKNKGWGWEDIYAAIKTGLKTSEWRDLSPYWKKRLEKTPPPTRANFTVGFPKENLPRLEADIKAIIRHEDTGQYEIQVVNVVEITRDT
ncbi:unnamed protein product [marine sediment metagenome]|uniref:ASCH domain-containing protein n=1 Tax=marine sediment metagenome TaxID=412755 RepID=X1L7S2_9ZZZZ